MFLRLLTLSLMISSATGWAEESTWGKSTQQMKRLQTVDPLAESRVPIGSPTFSGKKATKSFNKERSGSEQKTIKNKNLLNQ